MFRRWLIRSLFILPVLLGVLGWAWSAGHYGGIAYIHRGHGVRGGTYWGTVFLGGWRSLKHPDGWTYGLSAQASVQFWPQDSNFEHFFLGFGYYYWSSAGEKLYSLCIPYWFLILLFGFPLLFAWRKTAQKNPPPGFPVEIKAKVAEC